MTSIRPEPDPRGLLRALMDPRFVQRLRSGTDPTTRPQYGLGRQLLQGTPADATATAAPGPRRPPTLGEAAEAYMEMQRPRPSPLFPADVMLQDAVDPPEDARFDTILEELIRRQNAQRAPGPPQTHAEQMADAQRRAAAGPAAFAAAGEAIASAAPGIGQALAARDVMEDVSSGNLGWGTALAGLGLLPGGRGAQSLVRFIPETRLARMTPGVAEAIGKLDRGEDVKFSQLLDRLHGVDGLDVAPGKVAREALEAQIAASERSAAGLLRRIRETDDPLQAELIAVELNRDLNDAAIANAELMRRQGTKARR